MALASAIIRGEVVALLQGLSAPAYAVREEPVQPVSASGIDVYWDSDEPAGGDGDGDQTMGGCVLGTYEGELRIACKVKGSQSSLDDMVADVVDVIASNPASISGDVGLPTITRDRSEDLEKDTRVAEIVYAVEYQFDLSNPETL